METTVLLVDDHPIFVTGLHTLLTDEEDIGVIGVAEDGQMAIDLVRELSPDLVVMDISMPGMNGVEATREIIRESPDTKILALSIHREKHFVEEMLVAGARGYILKESVPEELVRGIRAIIRGDVFLSASITDVIVSGYKRILKDVQDASQAADTSARALISTKLHRPPIIQDLLPRPGLVERLGKERHIALSLVSAPAGYGKSTLIASWLETRARPSVWLTLDEEDNDPVVFLTYVIAAIQSKFPEVGQKSLIMLQSPDLPPHPVLIRNLTHDLDQLDDEFILVMDDYHRIYETEVHDLMSDLLRYRPRSMHLVIASRGTPPLKLSALRAQGQMTEIRLQDLRFTSGETCTFMNEVMGIAMDRAAADDLNVKTEGWVTALRLFALSLHHRGGVEGLLGSLKGDSRYTRDYLTAEVVSHQPKDIQEWLMKTSLLERFCAPLCEVVCGGDEGQEGASLNGEDFLTWLEDADMFVVPLDIQHEWFRFHHLFKEILQDWLAQQYGPDEIAALRSRASHWFAENGYIIEALRYSLAADDTLGAAEIVEQNFREILNKDQWYILEKWLSMLPDEIKQQSPELLVAQAWVYYFQFQIMNITPLLDRVEKLLTRDQRRQQIGGEIDFFKGYIHYFRGQGQQSEKLLRSAIEKIPETDPLTRGETELNYSLALHMNDRKEEALQGIHQWLRTNRMSEEIRSARLVAGLSFIHLLEGELTEALYTAKQGQEIAATHHIQYSESWSLYCEALVHYYQNNLEKAADLFNQLIQMRYIMHSRAALDSLCALALIYQALQYEDEVQETMKLMYSYVSEMNDPSYSAVASSCQAHLLLLQGDVTSAQRWLRSADMGTELGLMQWWIEIPRLTECRYLIAEGSETSLQLAISKLITFKQENEAVNNHIQLITVYSLMALAYSAQGDMDEAVAMQEIAIELAKPGRFIYPFVDGGPGMADLLDRVRNLDVAQDYIGFVLSAFPEGTRTAIPQDIQTMVEPLTKRELETLHLLATELSTEEIAAEMVVSTATVRTHTKHLFSKLDVHSRYEAVERGKDLSII